MDWKVIDVSQYNGEIDYRRVRDSGVKGVILRSSLTFWGSLRIAEDPSFQRNYEGFTRVGMPVGVYHYSCAASPEKAREEAEFVLKLVRGKKLGFPVYFDTENEQRQRPLSKEALTRVAQEFCETVERAGYYVGIYASTDWFETQLLEAPLRRYDKWVAQYGPENTYPYRYQMWQYTDDGRIDGIGDGVDVSRCTLDYPKVIESKGLNGFHRPKPPEECERIRLYRNGEKREPVYGASDERLVVGELAPHEECESLGVYDRHALVVYRETGTGVEIAGFVRRLEGIVE